MSRSGFAVAIPARDEEALLPAMLDSLVAQSFGWDAGHVFLVANNCADRTVSVAEDYAHRLPITVIERTFAKDSAHVGTARKLALDAATGWLAEEHRDGVLLTTDADAIVPADWVVCNLRALAHADIVGGRLTTAPHGDTVSALSDSIEAYWRAVRMIDSAIDPQDHDPPPRHGDHTGASLAFGSALYRRIGGLTPLPSREDVDFVNRALRAGARLRHAPDVSVRVSARTAGRASGGMAAEMTRRQAVANQPGGYLLPHPADWINRSIARRRLRSSWRQNDDHVTALLREGIPDDAIAGILDDCANDIAFVERASESLPAFLRSPIDVDAAVVLLELYEADRFALKTVA